MLIQIALKETEKAVNENNPLDGKTGYVRWNADELWWYDRLTKNARRELTHQEIFDNYKPYHEVKEIRPEKAGELWKAGNDSFFFTVNSDKIAGDNGDTYEIKDYEMIHGKHGWIRLFPPVEDENVERIEFEALWDSSFGKFSIISPLAKMDLMGNGPHKLFVEIPKDKP